MYEISYGAKYSKDLNTTQIAARFREDVKAAVKKGELPKGFKMSVRTSYYSGGSSIDARITAAPGVTVLSEPRLFDEYANPHQHSNEHWMTLEAEVLQTRVDMMLQAYNFDGSDIQSDYFNVKFYGHVEFHNDLQKAEREAYKARYEAGGLTKPAWDGKQLGERRHDVQLAVFGKCTKCEGANTPGHKDAMHPNAEAEPVALAVVAPVPEPEKPFGGYPECPTCHGNESPVEYTVILGNECLACRQYRRDHHSDPSKRLVAKPALRVVEATKEPQVAYLESLGAL